MVDSVEGTDHIFTMVIDSVLRYLPRATFFLCPSFLLIMYRLVC